MNAGIDYGLGQTNIDTKNGIRFGVISQHSVLQAWCDSSEPEYGPLTCPKCENECVSLADFQGDADSFEQYGHGCADYVCVRCEHTLDSENCFGDEPNGYSYEGDGYRLVDCLDSDIMILESPFYTFARFCSPCVPGAGNLNDHDENGIKTYCLGHNWFDDNKAPYPVYSVETGALVTAD